MCLRKNTSLIGGKALPSISPSIPLGGLLLAQLCTYVLAKLLQNGAKFMQKMTPGFKNHLGSLDQRSCEKSEKLKFDGLLFSKKTFVQLKHYIQRVYLTLLSTTCLKLHQIPHVIFEIISHFSRYNSSVFFQLKHYVLSTK